LGDGFHSFGSFGVVYMTWTAGLDWTGLDGLLRYEHAKERELMSEAKKLGSFSCVKG
jgi:hypothetical protein